MDKKNIKINRILFISSLYPSISRQYSGAFVREYIRAIASMGVKCTVISPVSIFDLRYGMLPSKISFDTTINSNYIKIIRPRYISFSNKQILNLNTFYLTQIAFINAVSRSLSYLDFPVDILFGHFLYPSGYSAVHFSKKLGIPSIIACGEAVSFNNTELLNLELTGYQKSYQKAIRDFKQVSGVISVSSLLKEILQSKLKIPKEKVKIFPNGVDLNLFFPRNKFKMRKKYGFPFDKIIIIFTGHFENRKGPERILEAIKGLNNVGIVLIGGGNMRLESDNILFKGIVKHSLIPEMLSVGDMFVLPTLAEGSCNAIIEALACGLPVITSKDKFNDEIVNDSVAIRIDPLNIKELRNAIVELMNNQYLRNEMSKKAIIWSKKFDINLRVKNIIEWMEEIINHK